MQVYALSGHHLWIPYTCINSSVLWCDIWLLAERLWRRAFHADLTWFNKTTIRRFLPFLLFFSTPSLWCVAESGVKNKSGSWDLSKAASNRCLKPPPYLCFKHWNRRKVNPHTHKQTQSVCWGLVEYSKNIWSYLNRQQSSGRITINQTQTAGWILL